MRCILWVSPLNTTVLFRVYRSDRMGFPGASAVGVARSRRGERLIGVQGIFWDITGRREPPEDVTRTEREGRSDTP